MPLSLSGTTGIVTGNIASDAVTTSLILNANVTPAKLSQPMTLAAAQNATGTAIDFTGIPSWARKIIVIFSGVSTNGTSVLLVRVGDSGGISATGYQGGVAAIVGVTASMTDSSIGFYLGGVNPVNTFIGHCTITNISGNTWISSGVAYVSATQVNYFASAKTLSNVLDRIRITTANGTDTFDAGSINIMYEG